MPLVRFAVRNECKLGVPELYRDAVVAEDPKGVLDGVAVASLVGILRQLGDLAELAAEVFHGLQEQVTSTASRSRKLVTRVQHVEASLPQLEKAILSQTSHIHYAYTPGSEWHAHIRNEQNLFICDDLPHFIMDSYEECREPPHLQLLDRFDTGGPGSCIKRYSDPTFFSMTSSGSEIPIALKSLCERKTHKIKKRRSWQQSGYFPNCAPDLNGSARMQLPSPVVQGQSSLSHTGSTFHLISKSDLKDQSDSLRSTDGLDFMHRVLHPRTSIQPGNGKATEISSGLHEEMINSCESINTEEKCTNSCTCTPAMETTDPWFSSVCGNDKTEIVEPLGLNYGINGNQLVPEVNADLDELGLRSSDIVCVAAVDNLSEHGSTVKSAVDSRCAKVVGAIQDVSKVNFELDEQELELVNAEIVDQVDDLSEQGSSPKSYVDEYYRKATFDGSFMELSQPIETDNGIDDVQHVLENFELLEHDLEPHNVECIIQLPSIFGGKNSSESIHDGNLINNPSDRKLCAFEVQRVVETNFDIAIGRVLATSNLENVCQTDAFSEGGNAGTVVKRNQPDDIESETDHYVDALNTIESESESDFESQTRKEIALLLSSKDEVTENVVNQRKEEITSLQQLEHGCHSVSYDHTEQTTDDLQSSANTESSGHDHSSSNKLAAEGREELVDSACLSHNQSVQCFHPIFAHNVHKDVGSCANQPAVSERAATFSQVPSAEETILTPHLSQEPFGPSGADPLAFWTNGSLLGLEPSKPTVFSLSNTVNFNHKNSTNDIVAGRSNQNVMQKFDGSTGVLASSEDHKGGNSYNEPKLDHDDQSAELSKYLPRSVLEKKHDTSGNHESSDLSENSVIYGMTNGGVKPHETRVPSTEDVINAAVVATNMLEDKPSLLSSLGRGVLKNGFLAGSSCYDDEPKATSPSSNNFTNRPYATVLHSTPETNSKGHIISPAISPPPSPPIDHMKISFRPIDGFENSRLKLKYPGGFDHHEISVDTFPSFQLVPGPTNLKHDIGSDSDDDTFCRSYACMSNDSYSDLSISNSEEWESGNASKSNDHVLCDGLHRVSSSDFASSSPQCEETAQGSLDVCPRFLGAAHSESSPLTEVSIFDMKNSFAYQEMNYCLNPGVDSSHFQQPMPQTPPLPPLQWRVSKHLLDSEGYKQDKEHTLNQSFDPKLSYPSILHSAKLPIRSEESDAVTKTNKLDERKLVPQSQEYQVGNGRRGDEREDFLHKIRTKSFNLRHTEPARSTYSTSAAAPNKVTAILRKANAIRQVVGSSDGEDDNWSDT